MVHSTKAIVLRATKYGDTSIIVSCYTELFGLQSYLIQGVRSDRKSSTKSNMFQPGNILDVVVYHHPQRKLHRIKEAKIHYWYLQTYRNMVKSALLIFCIELFTKLITEPETHVELYEFLESNLQSIDQKEESALANLPLQFTLQLAQRVGFGIDKNYSAQSNCLDLSQGSFFASSELPSLEFVDGWQAETIYKLVVANDATVPLVELHHQQRILLLQTLIRYLQLHIPHMGKLKSLPVLQDILHS
jgi:DNA repair protein RecO (recombination protein O)